MSIDNHPEPIVLPDNASWQQWLALWEQEQDSTLQAFYAHEAVYAFNRRLRSASASKVRWRYWPVLRRGRDRIVECRDLSHAFIGDPSDSQPHVYVRNSSAGSVSLLLVEEQRFEGYTWRGNPDWVAVEQPVAIVADGQVTFNVPKDECLSLGDDDGHGTEG